MRYKQSSFNRTLLALSRGGSDSTQAQAKDLLPALSSHHRVYAGWGIKANPNTVSRLRSLTLTGLRLSIQSPPERG